MIPKLKVSCPECKSTEFMQEVVEVYNRSLDGNGKVTSIEDNWTHDLEFRTIYCTECGKACDNLFEDIEIEE